MKCIEDEIPFDIPDGWEWSRFSSAFVINPRNNLPDDTEVSFIPMPLIQEGYANNHTFEEKIWSKVKSGFTHFAENDIGVAKITPCFENKKSVVFKKLKNGFGAGTTELHIIRSINDSIYPEYILWNIKTDAFISNGVNAFSGAVGQKRISKDFIEKSLIPIAPTLEQKRIIEHISTAFKCIDKIDISKEAFKLDIDVVKRKILDLAIQGQLVPQNPEDEPASVLLERIRAEKEELIKQGKLKRDKKESTIFKGDDNSYYEKIGDNVIDISDDVPFEIPENWFWSRLESLGNWGAGATPNRNIPEYYDGNIPWLKTGDLTDGYITYIPENISELALAKTSVRLNPIGTVLIAMYGATIGKLGILTFPATTNQACCACIPFSGIENLYLFYYLLSQRKKFIYRGAGGAQPNISKEKIVSTLIPIPPQNEQLEIIEEISKLFNLLSKIEQSLN